MSVYIPVELQRQVRARFAGGETNFENLCLACPTCNRYKAHRQAATDPTTNQIVPLFHPHLQVWGDHYK